MSNTNDKSPVTGHKQSDFAGTNTDRYGAPKPAEEQDNPVNPEEAQNIALGDERISGEAAEHARNKANQGSAQGRGNQSS